MSAVPKSGTSGDADEVQFYALIRLRVRDLRIDPSYQREVRPGWVKHIVDNFDPYLLDPLDVSRRVDGSHYVMDGQHRLLALREMGYDDQFVDCLVFDGLTVQQESRRFNTQDNRKQLTALERFRSRLIEGQSAELTVNEVVRDCGFRIDFARHNRSGSIRCVGSLLQARKVGGATHLRNLLMAVRDAYGAEVAPDALMVDGISMFLRHYEGQYDMARLIDALKSVAPEQLAREAKSYQGATRSSAKASYATVLAKDYYNKGLRKNRLPDFGMKAAA